MDTELDRPRWRSTANVRVHPNLQLGVEFNPAAEELAPLATLFVLTETDTRPAVFLGTSSDRIGSPAHTQSYYLTVAKRPPGWFVAPYASLNYSEWDEDWNVPFGAHLDLTRGFSLSPMYDGDRSHLTGSWTNGRVSLSALWVWYERAGAAVSVGF